MLMCEHLSNKEIASRLCIEVATVHHVHNVLDKLRVHRRTDAVRLLALGEQSRPLYLATASNRSGGEAILQGRSGFTPAPRP